MNFLSAKRGKQRSILGREAVGHICTSDVSLRLNKSASVDTPETVALRVSCHVSRDTVHGGNHRAKFTSLTVEGTK